MSKKDTDTKTADNGVADATFEGKTTDELLEVAKTLETQAAQYHTMSLKAQGALEVLLQMIPKERQTVEG